MKRLYRLTEDRMLGGVAAGMAQYFQVDPTLVRIAWVLLGLAGPGVLLYIICWLIIPEAPPHVEAALSRGEGGGAGAGAVPGTGVPAGDGARPGGEETTATAGGTAAGEAAGAAGPGVPAAAGRTGAARQDPVRFLGLVLVAAGLWFLVDELFPWLNSDLIWPVLIIALGLYLLVRPGHRRQ